MLSVHTDCLFILSLQCQIHINTLIPNIAHFSGIISRFSVPVLDHHLFLSSPSDPTFRVWREKEIVIFTGSL